MVAKGPADRSGFGIAVGEHRMTTRSCCIALLVPLTLTAAPATGTAPTASIELLVQYHTVCSDCHDRECSGRLSFDHGPGATRSHVERHLGETHEVAVAALFAMLRHVKETCSHYPAVPLRPAVGTWEAEELAPWRNARAGAYFIPLGRLAEGPRQIALEFDRPAEGGARIDDDQLETVADERFCRDTASRLELDADPAKTYFLHLKSGAAVLSRIVFH